MRQAIRQSTVAVLVASALSGCAISTIAPIKEEVAKEHQGATDSFKRMNAGEKLVAAKPLPTVERKESAFLPVRKVTSTVQMNRSTDPMLVRNIAVNRIFASAQDLAERLTGLSGIPVSVDQDVIAPVNQTAAAAAGARPMGTAMPLPTPIGGVALNPSMNPGDFPMTLSYSGTLAGLLDVACSRIGISWSYEDGRIRLFRYTSRTFRVNALPGDTSMDALVGNSGSSSGSGGGGGGASGGSGGGGNSSVQKAGMTFSGLSVWKGMEEAIKVMLSKQGHVVVTPALGTVTVTDTPAIVSQVEKFVDQQNEALARQVVVNVKVIRVELNDENKYGINWNVVYSALNQNWGMTFSTAIAAITGGGNLGANILANPTSKALAPWAGSGALIEALSTQGRVSNVTSASVTTINNQPAPIQVGRQTSYVASSSTTITSGVATTTMTAGQISSGFSMTVLPHIMEGNRMFLQYAMDLSSLLSLNTITAGNSFMQTPDLDTRNSLQRVIVNSGDTIVVSGFESSDNNGETSGVGDANVPVAGGSLHGSKKKSVLVLLIQPVLMAGS
ncbi:PilN family type IVB pilus formation outer membrane protein [Azonexus hydrophilus]|uniref:PilN family type IVB pilus formation outer membrane protein n=1 Tax=Azonexus hydrophilus TaxID=418702 RepID=A0ABZ2XQG5_9RHOO